MIGTRKIAVTTLTLGVLTAVGITAAPPASASYTSRCAAIIQQMNQAQSAMAAATTPQQYDAAKTLYDIRSAVVAASDC